MKLVSKRMSINQDTFAPEMEVVLRLPVGLGRDSSAPAELISKTECNTLCESAATRVLPSITQITS